MSMDILRTVIPQTFWRLHKYNQQFPKAAQYIFGLSGLSLVYGINAGFEGKKAQDDINFRKEQLSKPIYELKDEELIHPPWNSKNIKEWLYRPVRITGRPIHGRGMYVPRDEYNQMGFEYCVPFVTRENEDQSEQQGVLLSLGFIPHRWHKIPYRLSLEDAHAQTFDCFVSQLVELQEGPMFQGNHNGRVPKWVYADLNKMAQCTGFTNYDSIKTVILEQVSMSTPCDEKNVRLYEVDAAYQQKYPFCKTKSGALYWHNHMPWDWQKTQNRALSSSVLFGALGAILHFVK